MNGEKESPLPAGVTLARLVDEFVATMSRYGLAIDRSAVEQEMRERLDDIARALDVDRQTVLDHHAEPGWGRQMAFDVIGQIRGEELLAAANPAEPSPRRP